MSERQTPTISVNGLALREIRERTGITTEALAAEVGVQRPYISKLELGHSQGCSPRVYAALIRALNIRNFRTLQTNPRTAETAAA